MPDWLRRAGHGRALDGSIVTWSVAEGRRGRRWREVVGVAEGIRSSLLLELDPDGRFSHLELSTASGLLTLHPEPGGTLHGNAVTSEGMRHVAGLTWDSDGAVLVDGSAVCRAAGVRAGRAPTSSLRIGLNLALEVGTPAIDASAATSDGLPVLVDGASWALEDDHVIRGSSWMSRGQPLQNRPSNRETRGQLG
jgi:hypothetical protein